MDKKKKSKQSTMSIFKYTLENITTVHGTNQFTKKKGKHLLAWTLLMGFNLLLTTAFILVVKQKYDDDQIVTKINANCRVSQVPFPAVSICNFNLVSLRESKNLVKMLLDHNRTQEEIDNFLTALPFLKEYGVGSSNVGKFKDIMRILKYHYYTVESIMEEVHQKCENLLLYCSFNRREKKCDNIFNLIKTYEGHCCTFNYAALRDENENALFSHEDDMEYYDEESEHDKAPSLKMIATSESGRESGLFVIFNVEPEDYTRRVPGDYYGAKILLSDPNDYPETTIIYKYVTPGESADLKVEPKVFQTEPSLRSVHPSRRTCWFHDEVDLEHTDRYSFETCTTECKMKTYFQHCGCVPYKYPQDKNMVMCEFEDLPCLYNVTVYVSNDRMKCDPKCYFECSDKKYSMSSDTVTIETEKIPANITKDRNLKQLSALHVYYKRPTCNCYKLALLIDLEYIIGNYGGVFSLSFGGSIITAIELFYLFISYFKMSFVNCIVKLWKK